MLKLTAECTQDEICEGATTIVGCPTRVRLTFPFYAQWRIWTFVKEVIWQTQLPCTVHYCLLRMLNKHVIFSTRVAKLALFTLNCLHFQITGEAPSTLSPFSLKSICWLDMTLQTALPIRKGGSTRCEFIASLSLVKPICHCGCNTHMLTLPYSFAYLRSGCWSFHLVACFLFFLFSVLVACLAWII